MLESDGDEAPREAASAAEARWRVMHLVAVEAFDEAKMEPVPGMFLGFLSPEVEQVQ